MLAVAFPIMRQPQNGLPVPLAPGFLDSLLKGLDLKPEEDVELQRP